MRMKEHAEDINNEKIAAFIEEMEAEYDREETKRGASPSLFETFTQQTKTNRGTYAADPIYLFDEEERKKEKVKHYDTQSLALFFRPNS